MNILVIFAHPNNQGHCAEILDSVKKLCKGKKIKPKIIDLYKINYQPSLQGNELYSSGNHFIAEDTLAMQKEIKKANNIIFIYPIWWGTMPAILKGFFDRVFSPHFAYRYNEMGLPVKLLKDKKAAILTTNGGPKINYLFGNPDSSLIKSKILGFCGVTSKKFTLYGARKNPESRQAEINSLVAKAFKYLKI